MFKEWAKKNNKSVGVRLWLFAIRLFTGFKRDDFKEVIEQLDLFMPSHFSQIYDSGSCLGREVLDERVEKMLTDTTMLEAYIRRGKSEVHWKGNKLNHFELIKMINNEHHDLVYGCVNRVKELYQLKTVESIVNSIDHNLPSSLERYKLPSKRKEFIIKLVNLRTQKLLEILK